ncbi:secreted RxLR effector protein 161-like [Cornus florida]|uniref:secreted RxLR effector protein 161-like n=1 Tax=Cornus florida TaxID=4283 RepID=UPI0028A0FAC1|nr:secreted RxLR effector protein 161-like [Cornus florida]
MLVAGSDFKEISKLKKQLSSEFEMKVLGAAKQIIRMRINRDKHKGLCSCLRLNQCLKTEVEKNFMAKIPYALAIGSLMYAMVCTRPDIAYAVGAVSRLMKDPGKLHWEAVKWILRYLRGTIDKCLCFKRGEVKLHGYVDSDFTGEVDHRRSIIGYVFMVRTSTVSWVSQIQKIVALSTTKAEYMAMTEASKEMIWLQGLLTELEFK